MVRKEARLLLCRPWVCLPYLACPALASSQCLTDARLRDNAVDADGSLDIISLGNNQVSGECLCNLRSPFRVPPVSAVSVSIYAFAVDACLPIAFACFVLMQVLYHHNDGSGQSFSTRTLLAASGLLLSLSVADVFGDGGVSILCASVDVGEIHVLRPRGAVRGVPEGAARACAC